MTDANYNFGGVSKGGFGASHPGTKRQKFSSDNNKSGAPSAEKNYSAPGSSYYAASKAFGGAAAKKEPTKTRLDDDDDDEEGPKNYKAPVAVTNSDRRFKNFDMEVVPGPAADDDAAESKAPKQGVQLIDGSYAEGKSLQPFNVPSPAAGGVAASASGTAAAPAAGTTTATTPNDERRNVYVASLPGYYTDDHLAELFHGFGTILSCKAYIHEQPGPQYGKCKGFGFVRFASSEQAALAIKEVHGYMVAHQKIQVRYAKGDHLNVDPMAKQQKIREDRKKERQKKKQQLIKKGEYVSTKKETKGSAKKTADGSDDGQEKGKSKSAKTATRKFYEKKAETAKKEIQERKGQTAPQKSATVSPGSTASGEKKEKKKNPYLQAKKEKEKAEKKAKREAFVAERKAKKEEAKAAKKAAK